jgi:Polysaccharide lyase
MHPTLSALCRVALPALAFFAPPALRAQCATNNSICIGVNSDCQGTGLYPNSTYGAGTVEFMSGIKTITANGYKFEAFNLNAQESGKIEQNTNMTFVRQGAESVKCAIWKPTTGDSARAEISDGGIHLHPKKDTSGNDYYYWYGWSYYIPDDANWSSATLRQFIGQWRFDNQNNCVTMMTCGSTTVDVGGSGHHLILDAGKLVLTIVTNDTACSTTGRLKVQKFDLGTPVKGKWMDFMMQARWTDTSSGVLNFWVQKDNGGYTQTLAYTGPTWIKGYNVNSTCTVTGTDTIPGWQLGLYWANERPLLEADARFLYVDAARCNRTLCSTGKGSEGWTRTLPAAEGTTLNTKVVDLDTLTYTTSSGDSVASFTDATYATGGTALKMNTNAANDYAQTSFTLQTAGTYNIKVRGKRFTTRGTAALYVNGTQLGSTWDQYSTTANDWVEKDYGSIYLGTGTNTFKWVIFGKNAASTGYDYTLDKITLTP